MSRSLQDQFIDDDEEETCPLCVEEFDLTDKGFRPCVCGYQICQFCYHNVKNNMNGLCPACRRPYRDEDIEYKVITPEETAAHKARQAQKQKKTQAALQKEKQKAEADHLSRKHLAGLRVVQKNLVYVTGLSPTSQEDQLLQTLRGDQYFGQYGKIIKIVVSKARDPAHPQSVGVYVTYERKEDAASCIAAVDGSRNNGDRTLRAQFGTTKYCSAYLRNETCTNRNCMFLHEPGEANESYSRADLSALNAGSSQHAHGRPPPPQSQQPMASAAPPMARQTSNEQPPSPSLDRPALPSTASWASKPSHLNRAETHSTSVAVESPVPKKSTPVPVEPETTTEIKTSIVAQPQSEPVPEPTTKPPLQPKQQQQTRQLGSLLALLNGLKTEDFRFIWSSASLSAADLEIIQNYPPLFDSNGGARRRMRRQREEEQRILEQEAQAFQQATATELDDNPEMSGSLQLGGEPEDRQIMSRAQGAIQPPGQDSIHDQRSPFGGNVPSPGINDRGLTPQQHQQILLQTLKPNATGAYLNNINQHSNLQSSFQQPSNPPGHQRNVSRYSFANDTASASAAVKPVANPKVMSQQSSIMPLAGGNHFTAQHTSHSNQFYTSNVQGPPPGLKTTGTPPVSGNLTFGQGHGFATGGLQYGATSRNQQDSYYRELLRGRDANPGSLDTKHDKDFPPLTATRQHSIASRVSLDESRKSTPPIPPGFEAQVVNESRRSTPSIPPGLGRPNALPDLDGSTSSRPSSRPASRASIRRTASQILPAIPLRPGTPAKRSSQYESKPDLSETPTKTMKPVQASELRNSRNAEHLVNDLTTETVLKAEEDVVAGVKVGERTVDLSSTATIQASPEQPEITSSPSSPTVPLGQEVVREAIADEIDKDNTTTVTEDPLKPTTATPKRKHPGKLDIAAATGKQDNEVGSTALPAESMTPTKEQHTVSNSLPQSSKLSDSPAASPAVKSAPRTLRVVQTPKAEGAPTNPFAASPLPTAIVNRIPSRQPSITSIQQPGTPSSEQISMSDNVSITSTSQSRANSPPPMGSKVGTAPLRTKTKNQMKKERQERAKAIEEEKAKTEEGVQVSGEEPAQPAILSRKKKSRKEKENKNKARVGSPSADTTPMVSQPATPTSKPTDQDIRKVETAHTDDVKASKPGTPTAVQPSPQPAIHSPRAPSPPRTQSPTPAATPTATGTDTTPAPTPASTPSVAQLIAELKASAPEIQKCIDSLFRVSNSNYFKPSQNISSKDLANPTSWKADFKVSLTKGQVDALLTGNVPAIHYGGEDGRLWDRGMVSPSGAHLRALTKELESRFLELEKALHEMPEEFRFRPSKPQNDMKFPLIDLDAIKRHFENAGGRGASVMEQMIQDGSTMKKGAFLVDEATKYLNEFVIPLATPPAQGPGNGRGQQAAMGTQSASTEPVSPNIEVTERRLHEAKRFAEEKENALKKMLKKNKRLFGLS